MKLLPEGQKPYIKTDKRPEDIVGDHYNLIAKHFKAWEKYEGSEKPLNKAFEPEQRKIIGKLNEELLYHGYRIDSVSGHGVIAWAVMTKEIPGPGAVSQGNPSNHNIRGVGVGDLLGGIGNEMPEADSLDVG